MTMNLQKFKKTWLIYPLALFGLITLLQMLIHHSAIRHKNGVESLSIRTSRRASPDQLNSTNWQTASQRDPDLILHIKNEWLQPPSTEPLNLKQPHRIDYSQDGHSTLLDRLMKNKTNGFYIECGAYDGEDLSNTLYFEKFRGWKGLLIEADPTLFKRLRNKHRNAYILPACLSPMEQASKLSYTVVKKQGYLGGLQQFNPWVQKRNDRRLLQLQCFPVYSILLALGNPKVDFFTLDIEGAEIPILKTIPLNEVNIDRFHIEVGNKKKKINEIEQLLEPFGYRNIHINSGRDIIMSKI